MPLEPREVSAAVQQESLGSLRGCLVEGDTEQRTRERSVRRRSLVISILIQTIVLALLMLLPLFGKTERIAFAVATPIPPYGHPALRATEGVHHGQQHALNHLAHLVFPSPIDRHIPPSRTDEGPVGQPDIGSGASGQATGPECSWCINIDGNSSGPRPPQPVVETATKPRLIHTTNIDPAMLIRRVEPVYPTLAQQTHREGRVELRAIVGTDGSIQSLQVVSGDLIFVQSAVEAVQQWHYKPTFLGGQPVAVDTYITVIYTMPH
jgi:protein TonB